MKKLFIVESPGKIKKIQSILGNSYIVDASIGHVMDIPSDKMNIDIENNFEPIYAIKEGYVKKIKDLKSHIKKVDQIILAMDEDREGEAIADGLVNALNLKKGTYCRVVFNEITKKAILNGINNPRAIDYNLVYAQKARRVMDKYIGYSLSPCLWSAIMAKLSAGRVQSIVGRIIVEKEQEIDNFFNQESCSYFRTKAVFIKNKIDLPSILFERKTKDQSKIVGAELMNSFLNICSFPTTFFIIKDIFDKISYRNPSAPFITSTLQQEASVKFGFGIKMTMQIAQSLYEKGYITYMRTDSTTLSDDIMKEIKDFVNTKWGEEYYRGMQYKSKVKNAQEAHEAIRPTHIDTEDINGSEPEQKLYSLIWKRTVASQMSPAKINNTYVHIDIEVGKKKVNVNMNEYYFETKFEKILFMGFLKVYEKEDDNKEEDNKEEENSDDVLANANIKLGKSDIGTKLEFRNIQSKQDYDKPPTRYTEALMVKYLEKNGIGRPSTYATMVDKVISKKYAEKKDINGVKKDSVILTLKSDRKITEEKVQIVLGKEKGRLVPTELGKQITHYLVDKFPQVMDYKFTANMEDKFDDVSNGKLIWYTILNNFNETFGQQVASELNNNNNKNNNNYMKKDDPNRKLIGVDPETNNEIIATIGIHGPYIKLLAPNKAASKTAPIKEPLTIQTITLQDAIELLKYPYELGKYDKKKIVIKKGEYGIYLEWNDKKMPVKLDNITHEAVCELIKNKLESSASLIGTKKEVYTILNGQYGMYVNIKKGAKSSNVSLKGMNMDIADIGVSDLEAHIKKVLSKPKVIFTKNK